MTDPVIVLADMARQLASQILTTTPTHTASTWRSEQLLGEVVIRLHAEIRPAEAATDRPPVGGEVLTRTAQGVIEAAWSQGRTQQLARQAAKALESAQLLMSPEIAAELATLRRIVAEHIWAAHTAEAPGRMSSEELARAIAESEAATRLQVALNAAGVDLGDELDRLADEHPPELSKPTQQNKGDQ